MGSEMCIRDSDGTGVYGRLQLLRGRIFSALRLGGYDLRGGKSGGHGGGMVSHEGTRGKNEERRRGLGANDSHVPARILSRTARRVPLLRVRQRYRRL